MEEPNIDFTKFEDSPMFADGKKRMKEYELIVRRKRKIADLKKRIKSRRKRKKIYEVWSIKKKEKDLKRIKRMVDEKDRLQKEAQNLRLNKK